jgi:hypothetical protein
MICPNPVIKNNTKVWNEHDQQVLNEVKNHCRIFYGENNCVKVIEKTEENSYKVLCYEPKPLKTPENK